MAELEDAPWLKGDKVSSQKLSDLITGGQLEDAPWAKATPSVVEDLEKTAGPQLAHGIAAIPGAGGDIQGMLSGVMNPDAVSNYLKGKTEEYFPNFAKKMESESARSNAAGINQAHRGDMPIDIKLPSSKNILSKVEPYTGSLDAQPQTTTGKVVGTGLQVAPSLLLGGETLLGTGLKATGAGVGSEGAGEAAHGLKGYLPQWAQPYAEPVARAIGAIGGSFVNRGVTPLPQTNEQFAATTRLAQSNPELLRASSAGQITDTPGLRALEGRTMQNAPQQEAAFTQGAVRTTGAPAGSTFPEMVQHVDTIGNNLRNIRSTNNISVPETASLVNDVRNARANFARTYGGDAAVQQLDPALQNIPALQPSTGGPYLSGERYSMALQSLQTAIDGAPTSQAKMALSAVRDRLKQAFRNSVPPDVAQAEETLSQQYANASALARTKPGLGKETVTPQEVLAASSKGIGPRRTNANEGTLAPLAQDASRVMQPLPKASLENQRGPASRLLGGLGGVIAGGTAGHITGLGATDPAIVGGIFGREIAPDSIELLKNLASRGANTGAAQAYLRNQRWRPAANAADQMAALLLAPPVNRTGGGNQ